MLSQMKKSRPLPGGIFRGWASLPGADCRSGRLTGSLMTPLRFPPSWTWWQHEPCCYAVKGDLGWGSDRSRNTLWQIQVREPRYGNTGPRSRWSCMRRPDGEQLETPPRPVYEPFSGSGTTIIAAVQTGRVLSRGRTGSGLRGCRGDPLAELHGPDRDLW